MPDPERVGKPADQASAVVTLTGLLSGAYVPRAIQVAARLGLGRILTRDPASVAEIASHAAVDPTALTRLLRLLAEHGIGRECEDGRFASTNLSDHLHLVDHAGSGDEVWHTWGALPEALRSGRAPFEEIHGATFFEVIARNPQREANWNDWNTITAQAWLPPVVDALELRGTETVLDVGGGQGNLLVEILTRFEGCRGVLVDLPTVVSGAGAVLESRGIRDRCEIVGGDAFAQVPSGGDVYALSRVLFNWDRDGRLRLLRTCRQAMRATSRLLVVEMMMPEPGDPARKRLAAFDLHLWLTWGGAIPTRDEWISLFSDGGFVLVRVSEPAMPAFPWRVLEAAPK
jgi:hypothetical protein